MRIKMSNKIIIKILIVFFLIVIVFSSFSPCYATEVGYIGERKIIVSLGDSYSSGEGIPPFYNQDLPLMLKVKNADWLAHRSTLSWSGMLKLPSLDGSMSENRDYYYFVAASGATTYDMDGYQTKNYDKSIPGASRQQTLKGSISLDPQLSIFDELAQGQYADYVTLTLGGNDVGFVDAVVAAVCSSTFLSPSYLSDRLNSTWQEFFSDGGTKDRLYESYAKIADKAGEQAHILVAGYPKLLDSDGSTFLFSSESAMELNRAVSQFNNAIESIVTDCALLGGIDIYFISVEKAFEGHSAYSEDPYINGVMFGSESEDLVDSLVVPSAYSMHPNYYGACAYAGCVQAKIDELENAEASEYNTDFTLTVYDNDDTLCGDYVIEITGEEFTDLFGLGIMKKNYDTTIEVDSPQSVSIALPKSLFKIS